MRCPKCHKTDTKVNESRDVSEGESIRRRRECLKCKTRFTTYERLERPQLTVIKNDGTRQVFYREKLMAGLKRSTEKTTVTHQELEQLVSYVENELYGLGEPEIKSSVIGGIVMDRLAELNEVAYVRFASVYRRFKDITSFENELNRIKKMHDQSCV